MNRQINYTNEPMEFRRVKDFLPPPEELVLKDRPLMATLVLWGIASIAVLYLGQ